MSQFVLLGEGQSHGIEGRVAVFRLVGDTFKGFLQGRRLEKQHRAEVEIIAHASRLVVDDRMRLSHPVGHLVVVGIDHAGLRGTQVVAHALQRHVSHVQRLRLGVDEQVGRMRQSEHLPDAVGLLEREKREDAAFASRGTCVFRVVG